ncbi:MAG: YraN family protein [Oscillospiraceae bacterium]|nr:YraN family protein [Oscillospiraceae bacterium]
MNSRELGAWGEEQAAAYLRRKGYTIVEQNYVCRFGEIDLIARRRGVIAFVEVKLRKNAAFAAAREFVTYAKQQRIRKSASLWLSFHACELQPRFDVIEIYAPAGTDSRRPTVNHLEDAFS